MSILSRKGRLAFTALWSGLLVVGLAVGSQLPASASVGMVLATVVTTTTTTTGGSGCTPGFFKNKLSASTLDDPLSSLGFTLPSISSATIGQALDGKVGSSNLAQQLIRHGVAAIFNADLFGSAYSSQYDDPADVVAAVQAALSSGSGIESLKDVLDRLNNQGCPISRIPT
jgi:hypothetical protein